MLNISHNWTAENQNAIAMRKYIFLVLRGKQMEINELRKGIILKSHFWPEPVKVLYFESKGKYVYVLGEYVYSNNNINCSLSEEEFSEIEIYEEHNSFSGDPESFFLSIETLRYRFASLFDPLLAVNISKVDPLPHQIDAVYGKILQIPRIRFLIADDPGAGKTIMAGLILKELKLRHIVQRILIVCPSHLKDQWIRELSEKFEEHFELIDRNTFNHSYYSNVWDKFNQILTSMDFAKQPDVLQTLSSTHFDLTIVDEAHKLSAYVYGNKTAKSDRYKLGEVISRISTHLLFLTATPHKGDNENFRLFLDLLEPGFFATTDLIKQSILDNDNPLFIRRIKEELKDFEGKPLFLPRHVRTIHFHLSEKELELYNDLSKYVENEYNKALEYQRKNVAFALTILQRRFASSVYALKKSLERRKKRLEELLNHTLENNESYDFINEIDLENLSEKELEEIEKKWETLTIAANKDELQKEIQKISDLIDKATIIIEQELEDKLKKLKSSLIELSAKVPEQEKRKILVFTESKDTMEFLAKKIRSWGYETITIHGGMNIASRVEAEAKFKEDADVLVATEAAGEGINLQFCNLMINYDIPWNPNRLEQRLGRIHRYGQKREVYIHNFVSIETREGMVLNKLLEKINEIRQYLGTDKVFDVIGDVFIDPKQFVDLIVNAALNAKTTEVIFGEIDSKLNEENVRRIIAHLDESLASRHLDYTFIKEISLKARENRLVPEYTENFFIRAFRKAGGIIEKNSDKTYSIKYVPNEIYTIATNADFKRRFGNIMRKYNRVSFDKELAQKKPNTEFVSLGHPIFEAVMQWVEKSLSDSLIQGTTFADPDNNRDGYLLFYEGTILDGTNNPAGKRIFSFFYDIKNGKVHPISPTILWDLKNATNETPIADFSEIENIKNQTEDLVFDALENYKKEILNDRKHKAEIKIKYGVSSLNYLIVKLDQELVELQFRQEKGEDVQLAINNKYERKKSYEKSLEELEDKIKKELALSMKGPRFIGIARVVPDNPTALEETRSDTQIEQIGMQVAMEYERKNGRYPEDVSSQNLGYDIRSTDENKNTRYIEVKARAYQGDIELTTNEWFKAQSLGDNYFLYVVFNAASNPELLIIQNPAQNLKFKEKFELVRVSIPKDEILNKWVKL